MTQGSVVRPLVIRGAVSIRSPHGEYQLEGTGDRIRLRLAESPGNPRRFGRIRRVFDFWRFARRHRRWAEAVSRTLESLGVEGEILITKRVAVRCANESAGPRRFARVLGLGSFQIVREKVEMSDGNGQER